MQSQLRGEVADLEESHDCLELVSKPRDLGPAFEQATWKTC